MPDPHTLEPGLSRYASLAAALRGRIVSGEWAPGTALPAEQALAQQHGVALGTLRRAMELLAGQGLVDRRHGRGTFVTEGLAGAHMLRFFRFGATDGETPGSRILARDRVPAPVEAAQALGLPDGAPVLRLRRLRTLGGLPRLHEEIVLPLPLFDPIADGDTAEWGDLLYPLYARRCGVRVHRVVDTIVFGRLAAGPARALKLPTGHPCARVQRRALDLAGRCVEWRTTLGDADAFHYTVDIH